MAFYGSFFSFAILCHSAIFDCACHSGLKARMSFIAIFVCATRLSSLVSHLTKKTATHPCSGLFIRALPPLCTPILAEFLAGLCGDKCTFTQTFGKDRKNNSKCKMQSAKIKISFEIIYFRLVINRHSEHLF